MAENDISISEMTTGTFSSGALFPAIQPNQQNTYSNVKLSGADIGDGIGRLEFPLRLETENKSIFGAINEIAGNNSFVNYLPTDTASGAIAHFSDGAEAIPVKSLTAEITPIQAGTGTPSPSNPRAISGRTEVNVTRAGANIWDEEWELGTINSTTGVDEPNNSYIRSKNYIQVAPSSNIYCVSSVSLRLVFYGANKEYVGIANGNNSVVAVPAGAYYVRFYPNSSSYGTTYKNDIAINYPSTATAYSPYTGEVTTIDLGTTVYGGTLDVTRGKLRVTHGYFSITDTTIITYDPSARGGRFRVDDIGVTIKDYTNPLICNKLNYGVAPIGGSIVDNTICSDTAGNAFYFLAQTYTSVEQVSNLLPLQIVAPLATPTEIDLTPEEVTTLLGENNIFADSGNVDVMYRADIQKYIDKKISEAATNGTRGAAVLSKSAPAAIENKEEDQEGEE